VSCVACAGGETRVMENGLFHETVWVRLKGGGM